MVKYKGERHGYLWTGKGISRANYCGPGTNLKKRLADGDAPVNRTDKICQRHDIAYSNAKTPHDIRVADVQMLHALDNDPNVNFVEKKVIGGLIRGKVLGEDIGVFGPEFFTKLPGLHQNQQTRAIRKRQNLRLASGQMFEF